MLSGFENGKFYIDIESCNYLPTDMRDCSNKIAKNLLENKKRILLSLSAGLDSQSVLLSFIDNGFIPETYFAYMPGYNDNEYENVKTIDKKFQIKTNVIDMDVDKMKSNILDKSTELGITPYFAFWHHFLKLLPSDGTFIQLTHDPFVYISSDKKFYYYLSYNSPDLLRHKAYETIEREGDYVFFGNDSEMLYSILNDDIYKAALFSHEYFDGNGLTKDGIFLNTVDRYDYYIKPLIYGKYWRDELIYFPKFAGHSNIDWMQVPLNYRKHGVFFDYYKLIEHLMSGPGHIKRGYETINV